MESHRVVSLVASLWLGGSASTVFRALAAASSLGAGAALATASVGLACCVLKSGARHMLALRGTKRSRFAAAPSQHDGLCLTHVSVICKSFPWEWEAAVYDQLRSIITLDIITLEFRAIVQGRPLPGGQRVLEERAACLAPSTLRLSALQRPLSLIHI